MIWASRWRVLRGDHPAQLRRLFAETIGQRPAVLAGDLGGVGIFEELPVLARPHAGNELRRGNQFVLIENVHFLGRDAVRAELVGLAGIVGHGRFRDVRAAVGEPHDDRFQHRPALNEPPSHPIVPVGVDLGDHVQTADAGTEILDFALDQPQGHRLVGRRDGMHAHNGPVTNQRGQRNAARVIGRQKEQRRLMRAVLVRRRRVQRQDGVGQSLLDGMDPPIHEVEHQGLVHAIST